MECFEVLLQIVVRTEQIWPCFQIGDESLEEIQRLLPFQMDRHQVQMAAIVHVEYVSVVDVTNAENERHRWIGEQAFVFLDVTVEMRLHREFVDLHGIVLDEEGHFLSRRHLQFRVMKDTNDTWKDEGDSSRGTFKASLCHLPSIPMGKKSKTSR